MKALLIIAHGSRKQTSNDEVAKLASSVKSLPSDFQLIEHAFLELTSPRVPEGIEKLVADGASEVVILPYFLAAGYHVVDDLPELLKEAEHIYPDVSFSLLKHLGAADLMPKFLLEQAIRYSRD